MDLKVLSSKITPSPYRLTVLNISSSNVSQDTQNLLHLRSVWGKRRGKGRDETHPIQHKRNRYERDTQEPQRRTRPPNPQVLIHGRSEKREPGAKGAPHEVVPRQHAGRILRVRIGEVIEDGLEEEEGADGEEARANDGHDPVDARARRPAEPEQANRDAAGGVSRA